jgi:hypothetical protein
MINIKRNKNQVEVGISVYVPEWENRTFLFYWDAGSEWGAGFLASGLRTALRDAIKTAREEAYEQGWKDAKAKRTKETYFSGYFS